MSSSGGAPQRLVRATAPVASSVRDCPLFLELARPPAQDHDERPNFDGGGQEVRALGLAWCIGSATKGFAYAETVSLRGVEILVHNARRAFETGLLPSLDASACVRKAR